MTRATPKIASYEFTTLHPHIGKIQYDDYTEIILEDLPGIIEGAHANKGLGHKFLKHLEKSKLVIYVIDGSNDPTWKRNALNDFKILRNEIFLYDSKLSSKPFLIILNKKDLNTTYYAENKKNLENELRNLNINNEIIQISGKTGDNISELAIAIKKKVLEINKNKV
jgi:GTP-binding protein